jgi:cytochrome c peroxidase
MEQDRRSQRTGGDVDPVHEPIERVRGAGLAEHQLGEEGQSQGAVDRSPADSRPPENDEDGVTLTSPLIVGQKTFLTVVASAPGFLNAWIDFNADGDWADPGEQIFINQPLIAGANALAFDVPATARATSITFARYRFNSSGGLSFTGPAEDGEVEDYAVEILPQVEIPGQIAVRISEIMAGLNGDSTVQFVELEADGDANKQWGPQATETVGRAMLAFFDEAGNQSGRFVFPSNAPAGADTVLVATRAFADLTGIAPDFIMPPEIQAISGKVAFRSNPDNHQFDINVALSYGGNRYFGLTDSAGPANTNELPIMHAKSLGRVQSVPFGLNHNNAFQLDVPSPRNTAGQTSSLSTASPQDQGRTLFTREHFRGNGRTCATCHVEGRDQFGLTPLTIVKLPKDDPLFVFEANVNLLKLDARSQPSDLRGRITSGTGDTKVLEGSGDTYLIIGGTNLSGTITDAEGNHGVFQSLTLGNLNGPTPGNGSSRGLEDHELLEHGRGLILENIDGFARGEVFRASPHLLNLARTAPYGLSGEFSNLEDFSDGAVVQHFPKSLARVSGVDFRHPTREELEAITAFMVSISNPSTNRLDLDRLATTEAQKRGRSLFFGDEGRCSKCHSGPVLALSDGSLPGSTKDANDNFNTGVANSLLDSSDVDNLPTEPAGLVSRQSTRKFNTPSLFNIRLTAPFFHDGSAATLTDAVKFYDTEDFHNSPAGQDVGSLLAANKPEKVADLVAFLESLVELPMDFARDLPFGRHCPGDPLPGPMIAIITNMSATFVAITNVLINGTNASDFVILNDTGETGLAPGQTRSVQIGFSPAASTR